MKKLGLGLLIAASMAVPANAITTAQRRQILQYQHCLQWQVLMPFITCHL